MNKTTLFAITVTLTTLLAAPAVAIPRTWVSATGNGTACTRAAPCATFQAAHDATDPNGEIDCVDAGDFGGVQITKSITIDCTDVIGASSSGIQVFADGLTVRLRSLMIRNSGGSSVESLFPGVLFIENCVMQQTQGGGISIGIVGGTTKLSVSDTLVTGSNIGVFANGTATVRAVFDRVRVENSDDDGIAVVANGNAPLAIAHIRDSVSTGNSQHGIDAGSAIGGITSVTVDRASSTLNGTNGSFAGISASGAGTYVIIGRSTVMSNQVGLFSTNNGHIISYQNNHFTGNISDGAPTGVLSVK